jgi:probable addiction module antidote protein
MEGMTKMALKTRKFDPARYLESEEDFAFFLSDAMETGDAAYIAHALGVVARARGMSAVAKEAGLSRENLYRALSEDGNPELDTLLKVFNALGIKISLAVGEQPKRRRAAAKRRKAA